MKEASENGLIKVREVNDAEASVIQRNEKQAVCSRFGS